MGQSHFPMGAQPITPETVRPGAWPWRIGLAVESPELAEEMLEGFTRAGAQCVFRLAATTAVFEVCGIVEREQPDLLFVELAATGKDAAEWIAGVRTKAETPLVIAIHQSADPEVMIAALRCGASEFICPPVQTSLSECLDRMATQLESKQAALGERGRILGVLSAKGGCGATTFSCHLAAALGKALVADFDRQAPAAHRVFRTSQTSTVDEALAAVRRLNSATWPDYVARVIDGVDLLAGRAPAPPAPELWRIDSCFRFLARQYRWVIVDLGRQLNPACWTLLQSTGEVILVTAPDVLALYQTRSIIQTLTGRGFDKSRLRLVLNRNQASPQDFWIESIEQMFELSVFAVIPNEHQFLSALPRDKFAFPADSSFGRAITKVAAKLNAAQKSTGARKAA